MRPMLDATTPARLRRLDRAAAVALLGLTAAVGLLGCDTLECGAGTHREGDLCTPNVLVGCGPGTTLRDGTCQADGAGGEGGAGGAGGGALSCGPGTTEVNGVCRPSPDGGAGGAGGAVVDQGGMGGMGGADLGPVADGGPMDAGPDDGPDAEPDMAPPEACPPELVPGMPPAACADPIPGGYCVTGVAIDFTTGCALPADAGLVVAVIDPVAVINGMDPTRGVGQVGPNGTFAVPALGASGQLAIIIDEAPMVPVNGWVRSVSGVLNGAPVPNTTYRATAFSTPQATARTWTTLLDLPDGALEQRGFLVGRVLGPEGPVSGAQVRGRQLANLLGCDDGGACLRFFGDDLNRLRPPGAGETAGSGAFLVIGNGMEVLQDAFYVDNLPGYSDIPAGMSPGSGFHTAFVPSP